MANNYQWSSYFFAPPFFFLAFFVNTNLFAAQCFHFLNFFQKTLMQAQFTSGKSATIYFRRKTRFKIYSIQGIQNRCFSECWILRTKTKGQQRWFELSFCFLLTWRKNNKMLLFSSTSIFPSKKPAEV